MTDCLPFSNTHGEHVDSFVEMVKGSDGLYDMVVVLLHTKLDPRARVGMAETQLRTFDVAFL